MIIFKRMFTAKIQLPLEEMSFYSMVFSFPPCHLGDKTHSCENSALAELVPELQEGLR